MLSAVIRSVRSYPACAPGGTAGRPAVRSLRSSRTRSNSLNVPAPVADRDRTVSRRSEPSSRAALMGEQPNPWDLLQPQDATSRHRGAKPPRRYGLSGRSACYPRGNFYPLIDGPSTRYHRFTKPEFPPCSTCLSRSQATLYLCALQTISNRLEVTFGRLRYILGGDRPSQTTRQALFLKSILRVRQPECSGWYFTGASTEPKSPVSLAPTYATQNNPDINARL